MEFVEWRSIRSTHSTPLDTLGAVMGRPILACELTTYDLNDMNDQESEETDEGHPVV